MKAVNAKFFYVIFILLTGNAVFSQERCEYIPPLQTAHWMFGTNLGLEFTGEPSVSTTDNSSLNNIAGTASISDADGNLLFYTDGIRVYDAFHNVMPNGSGLSYPDAIAQSSLIVPRPDNPNQYYLFIIDSQSPLENRRLIYYLINMNANNNRGNVTAGPTELNDNVAEKLTGVIHGNGVDFWVVAHGWGNDEFYAYQITQGGVSANPNVSSTGMIHATANPNNSSGYMKISPLGDKIACAIYHDGVVQVFDFNNNNGAVTNPRDVSGTFQGAYGIEFSGDSRFLYFSTRPQFAEPGNPLSYLYQVDLNAAGLQDEEIASLPVPNTFAALQLALDGKIYVVVCDRDITNNSNALSVINNPKREVEHCNFVLNAITFSTAGNNSLRNGLPNFIQSFLDIPHFVYYPHCDGDLVELRLWNPSNTSSTMWNFGDGSSDMNDNPFIAHTFPGAGDYDVSVTEASGGRNFGPFTESINIRPLPVLMPGETEDVLFLFPGAAYPMDGGGPFYEYNWYYSANDTVNWTFLEGGIGEQYREYSILNEGYYKLEVEDHNCCFNYRIIQVVSLDVEIPTAFAPNSNPPNNIFRVYGGSVQNFSMYIYNRWGQLVFSEELALGIGSGWNGRFNGQDCPMGVYAYILLFDVEHEGDLKTITRRGTVMLLR